MNVLFVMEVAVIKKSKQVLNLVAVTSKVVEIVERILEVN